MIFKSVIDVFMILVVVVKIVDMIRIVMNKVLCICVMIIWIDVKSCFINLVVFIMIFMRMNSGIVISWLFSMVELVFSVISRVVSLKFVF